MCSHALLGSGVADESSGSVFRGREVCAGGNHRLAPGAFLLVVVRAIGASARLNEVDPLRSEGLHFESALVKHQPLERVPQFRVGGAQAQLPAALFG